MIRVLNGHAGESEKRSIPPNVGLRGRRRKIIRCHGRASLSATIGNNVIPGAGRFPNLSCHVVPFDGEKVQEAHWNPKFLSAAEILQFGGPKWGL